MDNKQKILIVDDMKLNIVGLRHLLNKIDVEVLEAYSGKDALALAMEHDFDLAILDVNMPKMNGYELSKTFRRNKKTESIPILFLTASYDDEMHMLEGFESGAVDYLMKPCPPDILLGKVNALLRIALQRRELENSCEDLETLIKGKAEKQKILIVDDKKENLIALRHVLADIDVELVEASSGNEALAATLDNNFALALLDVQMPGMNGYELAEYLRMDPKTQMIPVIFLTAYSTEDQFIFKGYESGAVDYITKPYNPSTLQSKVKVFLDLAQYRSELELYSDQLQNLVDKRTKELQLELAERKKAEADSIKAKEKAEESEEKLKVALGSMTDAIFISDTEGNFIDFNEAFATFHKFKNKEECKTKLSDFPVFLDVFDLDGELLPLDMWVVQKALRGETGSNKEYFLKRKDTDETWVGSYNYSPIRNNEGDIIGSVVTARDITEMKKAENALRASEEKHAKMVANIGDVIVIIDKDGINRYKSPNIEKWFGWKPEDVVGKKALENVHPDDLKAAKDFIGNLMKKPEANGTTECRYRCKNGSYKWIVFTGVNLLDDQNIRGILGNYKDISERKKSEEKLHHARAILQSAMDQSSAGIAIADAPDGKLRYVNDAGLLIRGENREKVVNGVGVDEYVKSWKLFDLDGTTPLKDDEVPLARAVLFGETCHRDFIIHRADEDNRIVSANAAPIKDAQGNIMAGMVIFTDITDTIKSEEEKEKLESQLRQAQKMEAVGQLAGGVAHDFNNMLAVINGYAEMLLLELDSSDPKYNRVNEIYKAGTRSADLTGQLLAFARKQTISPKILDLNETVSNMLKILQRLIGENIELEWKPAVKKLTVKMDPSQLDQIMTNLLVNARDAISGVGKIIIETTQEELDEAFCETHPEFPPGKYVVLSVSDNGSGIDDETMAHIFEPFYTTKGVGKGTGLGLATIFGIVKQNKGAITVSNNESGQGTTFSIYLPVEEIEKTDDEESVSSEIFKGTETVLFVEDDTSLLEFGQILLKDMGYTVLSTSSPLAAIKIAEEYQDEIHLLLTDVIMPEMSGRDLREKIFTICPEIKSLFMSGYTADIISKNGIIDEDLHFLPKPFTAQELSAKLRKALA